MKRTHTCGQLRLSDSGHEVVLSGWVRRRRDHGGVIFIDLCDREGITQVVFNPEASPAAHRDAQALRSEFVVTVPGKVRPRPEGTANPKLPTGEIEILAREIEVLNPSRTPPFAIEDAEELQEDVRLQYRYLDLRRPKMLTNLKLRHEVTRKIREMLNGKGFWEIETPLLTKSTPEGARDYLVPSRVHPGKFYALPQSPQLFKQMLMVAGVDRYFQIARCLRDEDLRSDRQPEFTQVDLEMSFVDEGDVMGVIDDLVARVFEDVLNVRLPLPIARMPYPEAMLRYGADKPDTRFGLLIHDLGEVFSASPFSVFKQMRETGGTIRGFSVPKGAALSLKQLEELIAFSQQAGAGGLVWILFKEDGLFKSPIQRLLTQTEIAGLQQTLGAGPGDCVFIVADRADVAADVLGRLRLKVARDLNLVPKGVFNLLWVVEFPLLQFNQEEGRFEAVHHPFTSPMAEDLLLLESDPGKARARAYDLVLNGVELGGGSIRIHREEMQEKIFALLKISPEQARERFGFLLDALRHGAPPHGGIALGLDRMLMLMLGLDSIRDVIAFPKTQRAICLTTDSPAKVSERQVKELHIKISE
ncbi:MAG: aspartate--tRNA ligase [Candidatus Aureabacteria bacterium]|nr:aspartate--tRNA ligase [Candidatus Auribacterota bacterium]